MEEEVLYNYLVVRKHFPSLFTTWDSVFSEDLCTLITQHTLSLQVKMNKEKRNTDSGKEGKCQEHNRNSVQVWWKKDQKRGNKRGREDFREIANLVQKARNLASGDLHLKPSSAWFTRFVRKSSLGKFLGFSELGFHLPSSGCNISFPTNLIRWL